MIADTPSYAIVGAGRWAGVMETILAAMQRRTFSIPNTRRDSSESGSDYKTRLSASLAASGARAAWLCIPPGPHLHLMVEAAIETGLHVVVEKPWLCSRTETDPLLQLAANARIIIAIDYQYCFLEELEPWRRNFGEGNNLRFGGRFTLSRPDRLGIDAIENLGSHLFAIRAYAVPRAAVSEIRCGYGLLDSRGVWIYKQKRRIASIDFLGSKQPLIPRFIAAFEASLITGEFALDLRFALRVAEDIQVFKRNQIAQSFGSNTL